MRTFTNWTLLAMLPWLIGCGNANEPKVDATLQIYTTFYPTTYFTERIAGDRVDVVCPLPADADPIFWMPPTETIEAYQGADLIVINGAGFEKWVAKVSLPEAILVDSAKPLEANLLKFKDAVTHSHAADAHHSHEGVDGHTWLDPAHAKVQADQICKALQTRLPEFADEFQENYAALAVDLDALDRALRELSELLAEQHVLASHPAYEYVVDRYGWNLTSLDLDPAAMPTDAQIAEIEEILASKPARVILWESDPTEEIAQRFESELELTSVTFSPCEQLDETSRAAGKDYLAVMADNIERLTAALKP